MRRSSWLIALAASLAVTLAASPAVEAQVNPGQARAESAGRSLIGAPAPRFRLETIDGEAIDLGELYGKKAVYLKILGDLVRAVPRADAALREDVSSGGEQPRCGRRQRRFERFARSHRSVPP
jgi:hypothetical protein